MALQKEYTIQVFDQDGTTFRKSYSIGDGSLKNSPSFSSQINGGYGQCELDLDVPFDSFSEGSGVDFMNIVKIYAVDQTNPRGRLIYTGFISRYEPYIDAQSEEGVKVTLLGLVSLLSFSYYKNGSTYAVTHSAVDPETIGRAVIDHFNTIYGGSLLSYSGDTTDPVGASVSFVFTDQKWIDSIKKTGELAGTDWWWKIDETGKYWIKAKPSTATHVFTIGRDIQSIRATKDSEKVVNDIQVRRSGGTTTDYSDATSQVTYGTGGSGKRTKIISDTSITDATTANQRGNKEIADFKDSKIKASVTVNNKYDIESVKVGETCRIQAYDKSNTFFGTNMFISSINYSADSIRIELEQQAQSFGKELDQFVNG